MTFSGCAPSPLRLMMRPTIRPVTPASTGTFTQWLVNAGAVQGGTESGGQLAPAGTAVAPALSPCQPLSSCMSPAANRSAVRATFPPRFGTSCHIRPLADARSFGLRIRKVATYSTLP